MGLEGGAQAQDGGEGVAQVVGDEGEELVLRLLEVALGGDVAHDALEAGRHAPFPTSTGRHLQDPAHTVGPAHRQLGAIPLVGVDREALEHVGPLEGRQDVGESRSREVLERPSQDHGQRSVGEDHAAVEVDLEDAVRGVLDHVLVVRAALLLAAHNGLLVATGHRIDESVHGGQDARQEE